LKVLRETLIVRSLFAAPGHALMLSLCALAPLALGARAASAATAVTEASCDTPDGSGGTKCGAHTPASILAPTTSPAKARALATDMRVPPEPVSGGWLKWNYMLGDLGGLRSYLARHGISLVGHYMSEPDGNVTGGRTQDAKYTQQVDVEIKVDTARAMGIKGGAIKVVLLNRSGATLSSSVIGNYLVTQQLAGAGNDNRLGEMSWTQLLDGKRWLLRFGYYPLGNYFGHEGYGCDLMNLAFCAHAMTLSYDSGWRNNPKGQWGLEVRRNLPEETYIQTGVFQVDPYNGGHDNGFKLTMSGSGVIFPVEVGWEPTKALHMLDGHYGVGGYFDTTRAADALDDRYNQPVAYSGKAFRVDNGRWGVYANFDQKLMKFGNDNKRGLILTGSMGYSDPSTKSAVYQNTATVTMLAFGPFASRPDDLISVGWGYLLPNQREQLYTAQVDAKKGQAYHKASDEQVFELDYGAAVTPWLNLRPNLQYVRHPYGLTATPNAFVIGADVKIVL